MTSIKISIESKKSIDFSEHRLFILESATLSGIDNLFLSHGENDAEKNKIEVLAAGESKGIEVFYESLIKEYGVDGVKRPEPYFGHIPTIDTYLLHATAEEAYLYADAWKKCNEDLDALGRKIQNLLK